jgi:hypothetical protein
MENPAQNPTETHIRVYNEDPAPNFKCCCRSLTVEFVKIIFAFVVGAGMVSKNFTNLILNTESFMFCFERCNKSLFVILTSKGSDIIDFLPPPHHLGWMLDVSSCLHAPLLSSSLPLNQNKYFHYKFCHNC